jgi:hypothetical protein
LKARHWRGSQRATAAHQRDIDEQSNQPREETMKLSKLGLLAAASFASAAPKYVNANTTPRRSKKEC